MESKDGIHKGFSSDFSRKNIWKRVECSILEKRSRLTKTQVKPLEIGRSVKKSIEIEVQG